MNSLRKYIRMILEDSELGKYAFVPDRVNKDVPHEDNTHIEDHLRDQLKDHFIGDDSFDHLTKTLLAQFLKTGEYNDILREPTTGTVLRGLFFATNVSYNKGKYYSRFQDFCENFGANVQFNKSVPVESSGNNIPLDVSSDKIESWTSNPKIADAFSKGNGANYPRTIDRIIPGVSVILRANVNENRNKFLSCPDGIYKLKFAKTYEIEDEILAIGSPIKCTMSWSIIEEK